MHLKMNPKIVIFFIISIVAALALIACGARQHATEEYKAYSGAVKNTDEIASILMLVKDDTKDYVNDYVDWVMIDKNKIDHRKYGEIRIMPGIYQVEWGRVFNISPMIKASGEEERSWITHLTLEAGHTYTIHARRTVGHGYILYSWITDDTAGQVIWGHKYIPGPYDYLRNQ